MATERIKPVRQQTSQPIKRYQERIDAILDMIRRGSPHKYAAEANGISYTCWYYWTKQGECDILHDNEDSIEARLVKSLRAIQAAEIMECRQLIMGSEKSHRGAEWTLERVYWKQYSQAAAAIQIAQEIDLMQHADDQTKDKLKEIAKDCDKNDRRLDRDD